MKKQMLITLTMGLRSAATAQSSITLRFTRENSENTYVQLSSVVISNLTCNWMETLNDPIQS